MELTKLKEWLESGLSINDIARKEGKSASGVTYWVKKLGLESKYSSFGRGGTEKRFSSFAIEKPILNDVKNWNDRRKSLFSYFLGIYLASGSLSLNKKSTDSWTLALMSHDDYLELNHSILDKIREFFLKEPSIYSVLNSSCCHLKVSGHGLNSLFPKFSGKKHHWDLELENWQNEIVCEHSKDFILGVMDGKLLKDATDGLYSVKFQSQKIYEIFKEMLDKNGIDYESFVWLKKSEWFQINFKSPESISWIEDYCIPKPVVPKRIVSQATKNIISAKRKQWLQDNPDLHPWKNSQKFKSIPCEKVKEILTSKGISFVPEFPPNVEGRSFAVDIAFPDRKIIWEINGNQHYEKDGSLKAYYQERHDLLVAAGWTVYEIPSRRCFRTDKIEEFISLSLNSPVRVEFDYFSYKPKEKIKGKYISQYDDCPNCSEKKNTNSKLCLPCFKKEKKEQQDLKWPTVEEMKILVYKFPSTVLGEMLGVSDVAISKFCKRNQIPKPPRGYWQKIQSGKVV